MIMKPEKRMTDKPAIPNKQIEEMFLRIASEEQVNRYMTLVENDHIAIATAYASNTVKRVFDFCVTELEGMSLDINKAVFKKETKNG